MSVVIASAWVTVTAVEDCARRAHPLRGQAGDDAASSWQPLGPPPPAVAAETNRLMMRARSELSRRLGWDDLPRVATPSGAGRMPGGRLL